MKTQSTLISAVVGVFMVIGWYFLLWAPQQVNLSNARDDAAQAETQRSTLETQLVKLRSAAKTLDADKEKVARLEKMIPDETDLEDYINEINSTATDSGLQVVGISPVPPAAANSNDPTTIGTPPGVSVIQLTMSADGNYAQMRDFIARINKLDRLMLIDSINASTADGVLTFQLGARVFTTASPAANAATAPSATSAPSGGETSTSTPSSGAPS